MSRAEPRRPDGHLNVPDALRLYADGFSIRDVAARIGSNRETVRTALVKAGAIRRRLDYHGEAVERILSRFEQRGKDDCWLWSARTNNMGYGQTFWCGRQMLAHHAVWLIFRGPLITSASVEGCHSCDTPPCVNPSHIVWGTRAYNMQDASRKGRLRRGEASPQCKYSEAAIRQAHQLWRGGMTMKRAAVATSIPYKCLWEILRGKAWRHLNLEGVVSERDAA